MLAVNIVCTSNTPFQDRSCRTYRPFSSDAALKPRMHSSCPLSSPFVSLPTVYHVVFVGLAVLQASPWLYHLILMAPFYPSLNHSSFQFFLLLIPAVHEQRYFSERFFFFFSLKRLPPSFWQTLIRDDAGVAKP